MTVDILVVSLSLICLSNMFISLGISSKDLCSLGNWSGKNRELLSETWSSCRGGKKPCSQVEETGSPVGWQVRSSMSIDMRSTRHWLTSHPPNCILYGCKTLSRSLPTFSLEWNVCVNPFWPHPHKHKYFVVVGVVLHRYVNFEHI